MIYRHPLLRSIALATALVGLLGAQTGREIAERADSRPAPADMRSDMTMTLTSRTGSSRTLTVHSARKGEDLMILWFLAPADDRGVAFLTIKRPSGDDEMRMWLPSFRRMRRISTSKRGDSFMGSDLSFEDLTSRSLEDYSYTLLGEEAVEGDAVWILEVVPKPKLRSSYSRIVSKVRQSDLIAIHEAFYDRSGELLKERTTEVAPFGPYLLPVRMLMKNIQKNHTTELTFSNIEVDTGIDESLFHERNLRRLP